MKYFWGLALIAFGSGYLAASLGYIPYDQVSRLWLWWPLVLVFIGLDMLTRNLKHGWLVMVAFTLLMAVLIYDVSYSDTPITRFGQRTSQNAELKTTEVSVPRLANYKEADVSVSTGAVDFTAKSGGQDLLKAKLVSTFAELKKDISEEGGIAKVSLSTVSFRHRMMWFGGNFSNNLSLELSPEVPTRLRVDSGGSALHLDLSQNAIKGVEINAGASSIDLVLGEKVANGAIVQIESGASEINITLPKSVGVEIITESGLSSHNLEGFTKVSDNHYQNASYAKATKKIQVILKTGASSITVRQG